MAKKRMNVPNQITVARMISVIILIAIAIIFNSNKDENWVRITMAIIFVLASFSDFLDGHLARKHNIVTTFGKFMDPIADKLLVNSTFIILTAWGNMPLLITLIIIARDLIVDAIRMIMVEKKVVIAASIWGKLKTVTQMICLPVVLLAPTLNNLLDTTLITTIGLILAIVCAFTSAFSGFDYFYQNRKVLLEGALEDVK